MDELVTVASCRELGNAAFKAKDYETAISHYSDAINLNADEYAVYSNRCLAYINAGNMESALQDARACVEKSNNDFLKGYFHLQRCLRHFEEFDEARAVVEEGLRRWPNEKELQKAKEELGLQRSKSTGSSGTSSSSTGTAPQSSAESKSPAPKFRADPCDPATSSRNLGEAGAKQEEQEEDDETIEARADAKARALKDEGNAFYKDAKYTKACELYSSALDICPDNAFYVTILGNRSATYMMLRDAAKCRSDCEEALIKEPTHTKIRTRLAMTYVAEGNFPKALSVLDAGGISSNDVATIQRNFRQAEEMISESPSQALRMLLALEDKLFGYTRLQHLICRCHLDTGNFSRVSAMTSALIRKNPSDAAAMVLHAEAIFRSSEKSPSESLFSEPVEKALKFCKNALTSDPDCAEAFALRKKLKFIMEKVALAKEAVDCRDFEAAKEHYEAITEADPKNKMLMSRCMKERANANLRLKNYELCIKDCSKAVYHDQKLVDAYLMRARAYQELNKHAECVKELETLFSWQRDERVQEKLQEAIFKKKKFERPDLYAELGVPSIASAPEIRKGYRQKAAEVHPDKAAHKGEEERKKNEEKFKTLTYYYEILSDEKAKALYDKGYDLEAIKEQLDKKKAEEQAYAQYGGGGGMRGFPGGFRF